MIAAFVHMGSATTRIDVIKQDCSTLADNMECANNETKNACDAKAIDFEKYNDTTQITNVLNNLTSKNSDLISALSLTTDNSLAQSFQTISVAIAAIVQATVRLIPFLIDTSSNLAGIVFSMKSLKEIILKLTSTTLTSLTTSLKSTLRKSVQEVMKLGDDLLYSVSDTVSTQIANIKKAFGNILNDIFQKILPQVANLTGTVSSLVITIFALLLRLQYLITNYTNDIRDDVFFLLTSVIASLEDKMNPIITILTDTLSAIQGCDTCLNTAMNPNSYSTMTRRRRSIKHLV
ncbi:unnamed protein product [Adineta steineri]|uniref:Uncharacterized protein n=1 Tax=Adineta steineri TaxID=433720 RepID=A0A818FS05_9BILA|nr:unnamed protein product [Adineta steineri]CAF3480292.1 unnamed protein product [Adineta steineri]